MKLHGYCENCHRVKLVNVSASTLANNPRTPIGMCAACQDEADKRIADRANRRGSAR